MTITKTTYGKLPAIQITSPDGSQAIVTLYGAHMVSWKASDGKERIFVSSKSSLDGSRAIRDCRWGTLVRGYFTISSSSTSKSSTELGGMDGPRPWGP